MKMASHPVHWAISPDILHLLYFQSFDDGPDLYLDILINTADSD